MVNVTVKIDADLYRQAEKVCRGLGMTLEEAFLLFVHETVRLGQLPFELTAEDREFVRTMKEEDYGYQNNA